MHQNRSVCSILQYMAHKEIDLSTLNWRGKFGTNYEGGIIKKNNKYK
jgi:hypothetical protein